MGREIPDLNTVQGFDVIPGMDGKVAGQWGAIFAAYVCRDCIAWEECITLTEGTSHYELTMGAPHNSLWLDQPTEQMVQEMAAAVSYPPATAPVFSGEQCTDPHRKFLLVGPWHCDGIFYPTTEIPPDYYEPKA